LPKLAKLIYWSERQRERDIRRVGALRKETNIGKKANLGDLRQMSDN